MTGYDEGNTSVFLPSVPNDLKCSYVYPKRTVVPAPEFDAQRPNVARIYNYLLGAWKDTYEADREAAEEIIAAIPDAPMAARQNRDFLGRVVRYLVGEAGIRQIIDLGSGMPNMGNVHEVAHEIAPDTRVVYVDFDPVVIAHGNALMAERDVIMAQADIRRSADIFEDPQVIELIDFARPAAVLMIAIMHFIGDHERPLWVVDQYRRRLAPGSYIALSHITDDDVKPDKSKAAQHVYDNATAQVYPRSEAAIREFFEGTELVMPGLVDVASWRQPYVPGKNRRLVYGGVGKIRERSR
jgi:S-adenosyl methyltransferase